MADARGTPDVEALIALHRAEQIAAAEVLDAVRAVPAMHSALREILRTKDALAEALARVEAARQEAERERDEARRLAEKWRDRVRAEDWTTEVFPWEAS